MELGRQQTSENYVLARSEQSKRLKPIQNKVIVAITSPAQHFSDELLQNVSSIRIEYTIHSDRINILHDGGDIAVRYPEKSYTTILVYCSLRMEKKEGR